MFLLRPWEKSHLGKVRGTGLRWGCALDGWGIVVGEPIWEGEDIEGNTWSFQLWVGGLKE